MKSTDRTPRARPLYLRIAGDLAHAIERGAYSPGERLPSLRRIAAEYEVSLTTAVKAYQWLLDAARVESRPRSRFVVVSDPAAARSVPRVGRRRGRARNVTIGALAMEIVADARGNPRFPFGAALPGPDLLPQKALARIIKSVASSEPTVLSCYASTEGDAGLRSQIARLLRGSGIRVRPDEVLITNGCMEAIVLALRALLRPGDTLAVESPTYYGILLAADRLGLKLLELPTDAREGLDLDALAAALEGGEIHACLSMPSFSNPLGSSMPTTSRARLVEMLRKAEVPLIEDDIYGDLSFRATRRVAAKSFDREGGVIYCSSFSKTIAPGFRLGYVLPGRHFDALVQQKFSANIATGALPQRAMAELLRRGLYPPTLRHAASIYEQRIQRIRHLVLRDFPQGTRVSRPTGGFVLWVELPRQIDAMQLYSRARSRGITISPGAIFSPRGHYRHHFRLSAGAASVDALTEPIATLASLAKGG